MAALRLLAPLAGLGPEQGPTVHGRARAALERDKALTLRAIKELEFDRAMGKVAEPDFVEMRGLLRQRAMRLIRQLEGGEVYKTLIERDLATLGTSTHLSHPTHLSHLFPPTPVCPAARSTTTTRASASSAGRAWRDAAVRVSSRRLAVMLMAGSSAHARRCRIRA